MPGIDRRPILTLLELRELRDIADRFGITPSNADGGEAIIEALAVSTRVTLGEVLMSLPRARLKALCRARGIDDGGREKLTIATRLVGIDPSKPSNTKAVPPVRRRRATKAKP